MHKQIVGCIKQKQKIVLLLYIDLNLGDNINLNNYNTLKLMLLYNLVIYKIRTNYRMDHKHNWSPMHKYFDLD